MEISPEEEGGAAGAGGEGGDPHGDIEALSKMVAGLAGQMGFLNKKVKEHDEMVTLAKGLVVDNAGPSGSPQGGNGATPEAGKWLPYIDRLIQAMQATQSAPAPAQNPVEGQFEQVATVIGQVFDIVDRISERATKSSIESFKTYSKEFPSMLRDSARGGQGGKE